MPASRPYLPVAALILVILMAPILPVPHPAAAELYPAGSGSPADFNGDGYGDLAIGVPLEDVNGFVDAGAVNVIYGSGNGLVAPGNQFWHADREPLLTQAQASAHFGAAVAWGDFDGDEFDDLAIGAPDHDSLGTGGGMLLVLHGSAGGLTTRSFVVNHDGDACPGEFPDTTPRFGAALAVGNFGRGALDDLAVGSPGWNVETRTGCVTDNGKVAVLYGSEDGLLLSSSHPTIGPSRRRFGTALAAGNLGNGGPEDLAIGAPGARPGGDEDAGYVWVMYGAPEGLDEGSIGLILDQDDFPDPGNGAEPGDNFGAALAIADFGRTSHEDLVIGSPFEDVNTTTDAGQVNVAYGSATGVRLAGGERFTQDALPGEASEAFDFFGAAFAAADFGGTARMDLAIAADFESLDGASYAGAVHVAFGSDGGLRTDTAQSWTQDHPGIAGDAAQEDRFGGSLTTANFGNGDRSDLAIGISGRDSLPGMNVGAVVVLYGGVNGLRAVNSQLWTQDSRGIRDVGEEGDRFGQALG